MDQPPSPPQYELSFQLGPGKQGGLIDSTGLPEEGARLLSLELISLIQLTYHLTNNYPITGDLLYLDAEAAGPHSGTYYCEFALKTGEMEEWRITKRTISSEDGCLVLLYEVRLARLEFLGPPNEPLSLETLLGLLPTPQARGAAHRWARRRQKQEEPLATWQQLAQWGEELAQERGFNGIHLAVIETALRKRGLSLVKDYSGVPEADYFLRFHW